jgi:hypothetical protein
LTCGLRWLLWLRRCLAVLCHLLRRGGLRHGNGLAGKCLGVVSCLSSILSGLGGLGRFVRGLLIVRLLQALVCHLLRTGLRLLGLLRGCLGIARGVCCARHRRVGGLRDLLGVGSLTHLVRRLRGLLGNLRRRFRQISGAFCLLCCGLVLRLVGGLLRGAGRLLCILGGFRGHVRGLLGGTRRLLR